MACYVAIVAIVNLGLGYALAVLVQRTRDSLASAVGDAFHDVSLDPYESR
jgi:hypothetical protein